MNPTSEQQQVIDAFLTGGDLVVEAGAGSGKTSTLVLIGKAAAAQQRSGIYLAYNKAIAEEAKGRFGTNVSCMTAHSAAYRAVGHRYRARLNAPRIPAWKAAKFLGITSPVQLGDRRLNVDTLDRLALRCVEQFCKTADRTLEPHHVVLPEGLEPEHHAAVTRLVLPKAAKAWADLSQERGTLRFTHDMYLKLWQLTDPILDVDFVLFDEAQDADPVIAAIVEAQQCQRVLVGDRAQAIYGWRGAVDAMQRFHDLGATVCYLTKSFRFGPAIAKAANGWLERLDTPLRITGHDPVPSEVRPHPEAQAVLTRTNAGALDVVLEAQKAGRKVHLVGGAGDVAAFVRAANELQTSGATSHPDLCAFTSWGMVQEYVSTDDGGDLAVLVRMIDTYGADTILDALDGSVAERDAELVVSTAHKAKGREWDSVRIGADFGPRVRDGEPVEPGREEIMLRYVAVTRAKLVLDPGPLADQAMVLPGARQSTTTAQVTEALAVAAEPVRAALDLPNPALPRPEWERESPDAALRLRARHARELAELQRDRGNSREADIQLAVARAYEDAARILADSHLACTA